MEFYNLHLNSKFSNGSFEWILELILLTFDPTKEPYGGLIFSYLFVPYRNVAFRTSWFAFLVAISVHNLMHVHVELIWEF